MANHIQIRQNCPSFGQYKFHWYFIEPKGFVGWSVCFKPYVGIPLSRPIMNLRRLAEDQLLSGQLLLWPLKLILKWPSLLHLSHLKTHPQPVFFCSYVFLLLACLTSLFFHSSCLHVSRSLASTSQLSTSTSDASKPRFLASLKREPLYRCLALLHNLP